MLARLVLLSLRHRGLVIALAIAVLIQGSFTAWHAPLDVFPEFVPPQVTIQTEAPGFSPDQVETLITRPVETAVNGASALDSVRSQSIQGLSVVTAIFKEGTDIHLARQAMAEKLATLTGLLPPDIPPPTLSPLTSSTMDLLKVGLVAPNLSGRDLRTFVDYTLKPRLLAVPGVAHANVFGGQVAQLQIQIQPEKLAARNITLTELLDAAKAATGIRGAGFIDTPAQRIVIQSNNPLFTPAELGAVILRPGQPPVRLQDVADILLGDQPSFGGTLIMGQPGVLITLASQYGANTLEVTHALEAALAELQPLLAAQNITVYPRLHRPATFIEIALSHMGHSLLIGGALVGLILLLFLLDWRIAFISFISIPLSLLGAVLILNAFGVTLNTMTLGGFAVAIGVVVDDAIIDVENILRRLRHNAAQLNPLPLWKVVLAASLEVRSAVVYATFIVAVVFLPVLTMSGIQGRFFGPLGLAFILSTLASLLVALTVTPALSLVLLRQAQAHADPTWIGGLKKIHHDWLLHLAQWPRTTAALALSLVLATCALIPLFNGALLPDFREGHFVVAVKSAPGTSLEESLRTGQRLSQAMLAIPHIATVEQQVGRATSGEDTWGVNQSEFHVELQPNTSPANEIATQAALRSLLADFPGIQSEVLTFLGDRIGETLSGETAAVVVNVFGDNLDQLDSTARAIAAQLSSLPGHADVQVKSPPNAPLLAIHLRPDQLLSFGFRPREVLDAIETAFQGTTIAPLVRDNQSRDLVVILPPASRRDPETVANLLLTNSSGLRLPLRQLADVALTNGRPSIDHQGSRRRQTVTCNVDQRAVSDFVSEARSRVASQVNLPSGLYLEWSGAAEATNAAHRELLLHSLGAFLLVLLLLSLAFPRPNHVALVLANLPFALVGGVLAVFADGSLLSIGSLVGFVTLFGISTRNSIMLISHYQYLITEENQPWNLATLARGASERLLPILMTALVTALGLLPLALGSGEAGREIEGPMALVILGGLITSTLLNLLVLPALAWKWGRFTPLPSHLTF